MIVNSICEVRIRTWFIACNIFFYAFSILMCLQVEMHYFVSMVADVLFFLPALLPYAAGLYEEVLRANHSGKFDRIALILSNIDLIMKFAALCLIVVFQDWISIMEQPAFGGVLGIVIADFVITCLLLAKKELMSTALKDVYLEIKAFDENDRLKGTSWTQVIFFGAFIGITKQSSTPYRLVCAVALLVAWIILDRHEINKYELQKKMKRTVALIWFVRLVAVALSFSNCNIIFPIIIEASEKSILIRDQRIRISSTVHYSNRCGK